MRHALKEMEIDHAAYLTLYVENRSNLLSLSCGVGQLNDVSASIAVVEIALNGRVVFTERSYYNLLNQSTPSSPFDLPPNSDPVLRLVFFFV